MSSTIAIRQIIWLSRNFLALWLKFDDLTANIGDFAGDMIAAVDFFETHRIRVSNVPIIENLCSAVNELVAQSILDPENPIFTGSASMKILERLKQAAYKDNAPGPVGP